MQELLWPKSIASQFGHLGLVDRATNSGAQRRWMSSLPERDATTAPGTIFLLDNQWVMSPY